MSCNSYVDYYEETSNAIGLLIQLAILRVVDPEFFKQKLC